MSVRVLPASAGMIPKLQDTVAERVRAPRIRGDDPDCRVWSEYQHLCSPHPRG